MDPPYTLEHFLSLEHKIAVVIDRSSDEFQMLKQAVANYGVDTKLFDTAPPGNAIVYGFHKHPFLQHGSVNTLRDTFDYAICHACEIQLPVQIDVSDCLNDLLEAP